MKTTPESFSNPLDILKIIYKSFIFIFLVLGYLLSTLFVNVLTKNKAEKLVKLPRITSFFADLALKTLGVKIRIVDEKGIRGFNSAFIVSNHLSYLDIFMISSLIPSVFIAGIDGVQENFLIGTVTKLSGSIFVERKTRNRLSNDIRAISDVLPHDINLVLYPEGTTTNGEGVLPFKSSLLLPAVEAHMDVVTLCFKYRKINGNDIDESNRDVVYFYGDMKFFPHVFRLMTMDSIEIDLYFTDLISAGEYSDRKHLRDIAYERISGCYESL